MKRKTQANGWKVTVGFENGDPPISVEEGGRYVVRLNRPLGNTVEVADLVLRDAVYRQLGFVPLRNMDYITVGVWNTEAGRPVLLAAASAKYHEEDRLYEYAGQTLEIEPQEIPGEREPIDYDEWEMP